MIAAIAELRSLDALAVSAAMLATRLLHGEQRRGDWWRRYVGALLLVGRVRTIGAAVAQLLVVDAMRWSRTVLAAHFLIAAVSRTIVSRHL